MSLLVSAFIIAQLAKPSLCPGKSQVLTVWRPSSHRETPVSWEARYSFQAIPDNDQVFVWSHLDSQFCQVFFWIPDNTLTILNCRTSRTYHSWNITNNFNFQAVSRLDKAVTSVLILATLTSFCLLFWYQNFTEVILKWPPLLDMNMFDKVSHHSQGLHAVMHWTHFLRLVIWK